MSKPSLMAMAAFLAFVTGCTFSPRYDETYEKCHPGGVCPDECTCLGGDICVPDDDNQDPAVCKWCETWETNCDGMCVDTRTNRNNCGECGKPCPEIVDNGTARCIEGNCKITCTPPFANCDHTIGTGCETKLGTVTDCTYCGDTCDNPQDECISVKTLGVSIITCDNVCVYDTQPVDCGELICFEGICREIECLDDSMCDQYEWCNPDHICLCGDSGVACEKNSHCDINICVCDFGFDDCSPDPGCETNIFDDNYNCGACDVICPDNSQCLGDYCVCDNGYNQCNDVTNGQMVCVDLQRDNYNCGDCGITCVQDATCDGGACSISGFLCNGPCDAGANCCYSQGVYVCTIDDCSNQNETFCNDPNDCQDEKVCCITNSSDNVIGICKQYCQPPENTMCSSDSQCALIDSSFHCSQDVINITGSSYAFYHCRSN